VKAEKRVDLKQLGRLLGMKGLTFGSPDELKSLLGVSPGSVCLFSLANDSARRVEGFIDNSIPLDHLMQNHPLINTETLVLLASGMIDFCLSVGHPLTRIELPERV
jgi:Ala-tRNA(Pro) deacylase